MSSWTSFLSFDYPVEIVYLKGNQAVPGNFVICHLKLSYQDLLTSPPILRGVAKLLQLLRNTVQRQRGGVNSTNRGELLLKADSASKRQRRQLKRCERIIIILLLLIINHTCTQEETVVILQRVFESTSASQRRYRGWPAAARTSCNPKGGSLHGHIRLYTFIY